MRPRLFLLLLPLALQPACEGLHGLDGVSYQREFPGGKSVVLTVKDGRVILSGTVPLPQQQPVEAAK